MEKRGRGTNVRGGACKDKRAGTKRMWAWGGEESWDGELDHQVFFSVHFDLGDGAVGVGRDL